MIQNEAQSLAINFSYAPFSTDDGRRGRNRCVGSQDLMCACYTTGPHGATWRRPTLPP